MTNDKEMAQAEALSLNLFTDSPKPIESVAMANGKALLTWARQIQGKRRDSYYATHAHISLSDVTVGELRSLAVECTRMANAMERMEAAYAGEDG